MRLLSASWTKIAFSASLLCMTPVAAQAAPETYKVDPQHTTVAFMVSHVGFAKVLGTFQEVDGQFVYDAETNTLQSASARIDANSVDTHHDKRDGHVRSDDFLDSGDNPVISFVMTQATPTTDDTGKVRGDMTIRGVTRPVVLDVVLNKAAVSPLSNKMTMGVSARTTIKRSDFGMTYGVENGWVGDEVDIIVEFEAIRQ